MHTCKKAQLDQAMHDLSDHGLDMWKHAARSAHRTHDLRKLLQLANSQGLQQLNAAQRLDQSLAISFARGHNCVEGVGIQLKQNTCNTASLAFLQPWVGVCLAQSRAVACSCDNTYLCSRAYGCESTHAIELLKKGNGMSECPP
jgi:hypothetical protein